MSTLPVPEVPQAPENLPFVVPCRTLDTRAPLRWLRLAWADMRRAPRLSLTYGLALMALSLLVALFAWRFGTLGLYIGLATGFVFVGPVLALGLYSISRQLAKGLQPVMGHCLREGTYHLKELLVLGIVLLVVLLVWARAAAMVHVFFPAESRPGLVELLPFLAIGSMVGALFALIVFAASAFSLPFILDRKVDAITASVSSFNAVLRNRKAMALWVALIGGAVLLGFATAFVGFVVLLPLIGHATWHGYVETLDTSAWPQDSLGDAA